MKYTKGCLIGLYRFVCDLLSAGVTDSEITGAGTWMDVMLTFTVPSVNVSPEWQSSPKIATISPGPASVMSSISSACMRTRRPTLVFLPLRLLVMTVSLVR